MKGYQKLAVFLAVLLFSVGLMSVAIDILGDITDLEFDVDTRLEGASSVGSEEGEVGKRKGEKVKVEGAPGGGATPLFEITYPPMTRYLRWIIGEEYDGGEWQSREGHEWFQYQGENLELELLDQPQAEYFFTIRPFFNISGFIPGTLHTTRVGGITNLERYPHLALFASPEPFSLTYGITHAAYEHAESTLRIAEITPNDDYLQVPEEIADRLRGFAMEIVEDSSTPWEQLKAIETYLKTTFEYNQGLIHPRDLALKSTLMYQRGDLEGRSILLIGDDDLFGIFLALLGLSRSITVLEVDERFIRYIDQKAKRHRLSITAKQYDVNSTLPPEFQATFDTFVTEPPEGLKGMLLFLERAVDALEIGGGGYFGLTTLESSLPKWLAVQRFLMERGMVITDLLRNFSLYPESGDPVKDYEEFPISQKLPVAPGLPDVDYFRSSLIRVEKTTRVTMGENDGIYTDEDTWVTVNPDREK